MTVITNWIIIGGLSSHFLGCDNLLINNTCNSHTQITKPTAIPVKKCKTTSSIFATAACCTHANCPIFVAFFGPNDVYFWPHWPEVYVGAIPISLPIICSESVTTAGVNRYRVSVIVHNRCVSSYICRYRTYPAVTSFIFNNNDWSADGSAENAGVENAGVENAGVERGGGKCGSGKGGSR